MLGRKRITPGHRCEMGGDLLSLKGNLGVQFPAALFFNNADRPFEIHRMIARVVAFDDSTPPDQVDPVIAQSFKDVLDEYVRIQIEFPREAKVTKANTVLATLLRRDRQNWEFEAPYTLNKG